ncbi:MAG: hypothetical protein ACPKPY_08670 [Nitrososphaeraceae archaeon]
MSLEEKIFDKIFSSGISGVKRVELRKNFSDIDVDKAINSWIENGEIILSKKANTYYYWHKDNYFQYLLTSDPKFKYVFEVIQDLQKSYNGLSETVNKQIDKIDSKVILLMDSLLTKTPSIASVESPKKKINFNKFKEDFDLSISNNASSIGWVELVTIRNILCSKYEITEQEFYDYIQQIIDNNSDNYELSSGGKEGLMIRGLLHGFVRCL